MPPHCLSITQFTKREILGLLELAKRLKHELATTGHNQPLLKAKTLAMVFEKPSLRTRVSFEVGMTQLGGHALYLGPSEIGLGQRESVSDVAIVLSSMVDGIMARVFDHQTVIELSQHSSVPVINGLSDLEHPCQILADLLTIWEIKGTLPGLKVAFIGDGNNNVTHSLALACAILGIHFSVASPAEYQMKPQVQQHVFQLSQQSGSQFKQCVDPLAAVVEADIIYTDTWVSMGAEAEKQKRLATFKLYQVTQELMNQAKSDCIFMHDLPAYRGSEVTPEVIDGPASVVFQQAENRLHAQKALLVSLLAAKGTL